ncbi:MAG: hypothetical protein CL570_07975 [Alphaproteobacteria bacterium]|nr:hypothetical protein [Alphaproteobacteria bacterium]HCQ71387.1 hypothetical protein [Rhodospirillaceae bacterium]
MPKPAPRLEMYLSGSAKLLMMFFMNSISIHCDNAPLRRNIQALLIHYGFDALCHITDNPDTITDDMPSIWIDHPAPETFKQARTLGAPMRIGHLFDCIENIAREVHDNRTVTIGPYTLNASENFLNHAKDNAPHITLTDTEKRLLILLAENKGRAIGREDLLREIWGYRPDLDTHTAETHIYRLRQKIEADPSSPKILLTKNDGYMLA